MLSIDEDQRTIYFTRGNDTNELNHLAFYLPVLNQTTGKEEKYNFKPEDKISLIISERKGYTKPKVLVIEHTLREMGYVRETQYPELILTQEDTNKFDYLNKNYTYWYEVVLNDTHTIIGHEPEEGAAKFVVLPSGKDLV